MPTDSYTSIAAFALVEPPKVKGSRFIGEAFPVESAEEAEAHVARIKKREYTATHVCSAYRIGADVSGEGGDVWRANDDGEPNGSAGQPILRQIEGRGLTNVLVTVTRYYGGTKLGVGGLVRAYGDAAAAVLNACTPVEHILRVPVTVRFAYPDTSPAMHTVGRFDAEIADTTYTADGTALHLRVRRSDAEPLVAAFTEALSGRGDVEVGRAK
ncbi:MAG: YigZ family protein [Bacteroidota bacterium]